ncbi:hypothetical protein C8R43DRAFT_1140063 [Mycena crocata]|nr:hypothetical protein C8R43DRAFT_1140063 [Mycena crocata]
MDMFILCVRAPSSRRTTCSSHGLRRPLTKKIFVWSDAITFLLQASGGGLTATKNISTANIGNKITMIGLSLQLLSFALFTVLILVFSWRVSQSVGVNAAQCTAAKVSRAGAGRGNNAGGAYVSRQLDDLAFARAHPAGDGDATCAHM